MTWATASVAVRGIAASYSAHKPGLAENRRRSGGRRPTRAAAAERSWIESFDRDRRPDEPRPGSAGDQLRPDRPARRRADGRVLRAAARDRARRQAALREHRHVAPEVDAARRPRAAAQVAARPRPRRAEAAGAGRAARRL